jgi:hypothetical protein
LDVVVPALNPLSLGFATYRIWRRLPPAQRRLVLELARKHGPKVAAAAVAAASTRARTRTTRPPT